MTNTITILILAPFIFFLSIFTPEVVAYSSQKAALDQLAQRGIELAEKYGGFEEEIPNTDRTVIEEIENYAKRAGIDYYDRIHYTAGRKQHNETLEIIIEGKYEFRSFIFLSDEKSKVIPLRSIRSGVSEVYFR